MAKNDEEELSPQQKAAQTRAANKEAEEAAAEEQATAENTGAVSAEQQAVRTGVSSDDLNPAFASPEAQEQTKKNWAGEAEHQVDAEAVLKEQESK
jgi:hypothetical protein